MSINLVIAEDQTLVRDALTALIGFESDLNVVASCGDGAKALSFINDSVDMPDLVLTDIEMPNMTGIELAEILQQQQPSIKVVIMTTFAKAGYMRRAIEAGVNGIVLKEAPSDYLIASLRKVIKGERVIDTELAMMALGDKDPLNDKERKALKLGAQGLSTAEIAEKLFIAKGTVRNYLSEAISKMNATNRVDAARIASQKGWL
ncbi:response regulator transcription factor [Aliiglaciecola lipolytica]|uniref:Two-component system, NarL family, response regulator DesR n=1 Tax=Aliiglaciecola lipolytica E3 TaxID=1127673 RepID=K6Y993_9ALTE|nr:response regulator transcription factor [Aliiglaciecola lipolytica]GAC13243.1 two-component system, NarL family, response regulator DesR [Aliiglaciecola lipolytica E3]